MLIECIPTKMRLQIYLELRSWLIHLDQLAKPDREKLIGTKDSPGGFKVSQIKSPDSLKDV